MELFVPGNETANLAHFYQYGLSVRVIMEMLIYSNQNRSHKEYIKFIGYISVLDIFGGTASL
jgi:hypothetical protein